MEVESLLSGPAIAVAQRIAEGQGEFGSHPEDDVALIGHGLLDIGYADRLVGCCLSELFVEPGYFIAELLNVMPIGFELVVEGCLIGGFVVVGSLSASQARH